MKKKKFVVKKVALNVLVENQDLRGEFGLNVNAERLMKDLTYKVSPHLYGMLIQQMLGFHADMQIEMAEDLVEFACEHIARSTGCPSVDYALDACYTWIAAEHDIIKEGYKNYIYK